MDDLWRRQRMRLTEGGDPHSKLHRLSELTPTTGKYWYRPDMTAEHHAATACDWKKRAPLSFRAQTAARGRAGSRATFETQLARAQQQWLFIEPCMREPLMVTPLSSDEHPHFKRPPPQGWSHECYAAAVLELAGSKAKRARHRRQRVGLEEERARDVSRRLDALLAEVTVGSERLYDGLPASSLDGQALTLAIKAHLGRPAIPPPSELLQGLCAAAGLSVDRATASLHLVVDDLRLQAEAIGTAVGHSQNYWRAMLEGLPDSCCAPLSPPVGGVDVLSANIKVVGCASASLLGSRKVRMRWWRHLVVPEAHAASRPRPWLPRIAAASATASLRLLRLLLLPVQRFTGRSKPVCLA